jgi:putative N6-adenine-specific DNA methylase
VVPVFHVEVQNLYNYFAVTAPGIAPFTIQEMHTLHLPPVPEPGGISFTGDLASLYRANLHLRTASRILARLGNFFHATTFKELQEFAACLPWERFLTPGQPIALHVTCHKSKLYHTGAVARSLSAGLSERLGKPSSIIKSEEETAGHPPQLIIVRLVEDKCTISADSSGELLHKRGYRQAIAKAPVRETLAAALLMASGWEKSAPLLDPFCGSGTIPIEAALMARNIPPGMNRRFAFMDWPGFEPAVFHAQRLAAGEQQTPSGTIPAGMIMASDRDAGAVKLARENAVRAGVEKAIEFKCQAVSSIQPPAQTGWVVTNPPYGARLSPGKDLRNLYAQLGNVLRRNCPGWDVAVLCNDLVLLGQMGLELDTSVGFVNGGIPVRLARGKVSI